MSWPSLPYEAWGETRATLHRWTQMVGKVRLALVAPRSHWWHTTLYVSARGLTTGLMAAGERALELELDVVEHRLRIRTSEPADAGFPLRDGLSCAAFHRALFDALAGVGVTVAIDPRPLDLDGPAFPDDTVHDRYDADAAARWWTILRRTEEVLDAFRARFVGKASPIHLFWHGFDFAHTRFSGRRVPGAPTAGRIAAQADSHELIGFGWSPGDPGRPYPAFYAYAAPEPPALSSRALAPEAASWQDSDGGAVAILPYDAVRTSPAPAADVLAFFESAYLAGARAGGWDVEDLRRA